MGTYRSKEELVKILSTLWDRIIDTPEISKAVSSEKLILKFRFSDLGTELFIDLSGDTIRYYWDPDNDAKYDVEMIVSSDTAHKFWMEDLNIPLAIATRKVIAKGSIQKALRLLPALRPAFALYPEALKAHGREELLRSQGQSGRKMEKGLLPAVKRIAGDVMRKLGKARIDMGVLPEVDIKLIDPPKQRKPETTVAAVREATPLDLYECMLKIRAFEEHLASDFKAGNLPTEAIHLSIGQEGVAAGVCMNLQTTDFLNTTHRGHGDIIAKGADIKKMMAELYGKADGLCKGLGGSMHVTDGSRGILGANGIVGAGFLLGLGAGFSIKHHLKTDDISVIVSGDGSVNQGMFHEAMNMISIMNLPVLIVIQNNLYGEFTSLERHSAVTEIYKRAAAYKIESFRFDGNDVLTVHSEVGKIIGEMRKDGRPRLVELMTYRWHGHMEGDPETYRPDDEKEKHMANDPIARLEKTLLSKGVGENELKAVRQKAEGVIRDALEFAEASPLPDKAVLFSEIYSPEDRLLYSGDFEMRGIITSLSYSQAINMALEEEMKRDASVFLWGEDVALGGYFNVTSGLVEKFGDGRIIDTPISENGFVGGAVGAAMTGMRPVAEILFGDFLTCCMDPIMNQAAKLRQMTGGQVSIPMTVRTPVGSGIGMAAQHSQSMERFFTGIPGLIVVSASDAFTAKGLLKSAIRSNNPVLFFEHKLLYPDSGNLPKGEYLLPLCKARVVRPGRDATLVTYSMGVSIAKSASEILAASGMEIEIIDLLTLYPMDTKTVLESLAKTGRLIVLEEATFTGSVGSEVIARVALAGFGLLKAAPIKISAPDCPIPYAKNLENLMMPSPELAAAKIAGMLGKKPVGS
jgi:2-oxoisovalerate dehydrogenase E1 component